ncbi:unnamed protein product [Ectocarpus sp. CCAP 1310/34]|nr:unnamed protein product [Ectocarpus sp. CCAP 1310/34]
MLASTGRRALRASVAAAAKPRTCPAPCAAAPLSSMSDPKPRNYGEVATTVENRSSAKDALQKSCYFKIDFGISENATVYEAVQRFAAYNIGALAVTNDDKKVIGIVSERDYVSKVALLGKASKSTPVKEIATMGANLVVASKSDTMQDCMAKMVARDIRHLPVVDEEKGQVVGMLSVKDLLKEVTREKEEILTKVTDFKLGRGGFFEHT